jgi:predicted AlkP superfamily phosphohydrolase/phosphomutase
MDYELTKQMMESGELPNFAKVAAGGGFQPLGTSVPPLSPVAWSDFITGMDSGGHGIFDFLHRDTEKIIPYFSTSRPLPPDHVWKLGKYQLASGGGHELLRQGEPFWEPLERAGVTTYIIRIPADFPPTGTATRELTGMGTPDVVGSYGIFHFYTSKLFAFAGQDIGGGEVHEIWPEEGVLETELYGPDNPFLSEKTELTAPLTVYLDPDEERAKFVVGDEEIILESGDWSGWVPFEFEMIPSQSLHAIARFYLRSVRPELEFYVSPINFDPMTPDAPISHPADFAADVARLYGARYYTQGMPEDTRALQEEVLTHEEFLEQAEIVADEYVEQFPVMLSDFQKTPGAGLFFYYLGNTDLVSHMMWHTLDPGHPGYVPERDEKLAHVIPDLYRMADGIVGKALEMKGEDTTVVIMSDHGFASWRRAFSLNSWLAREGYLALKGPHLEDDPGFFVNVDWSKTRAYNVGIGGGLYVNLKGREARGIVDSAEREALLEEIGEKLLQEIDPATGSPAVTRVYYRDRFFKDKGAIDLGPDLIAGYAEGTRNANESAMGGVPKEVVFDNLTTWTGDHGMDHTSVPGILLYDRPFKKPATSLADLAASILAEFGVEGFPSARTAEWKSMENDVLARR